jgi:hypothetical protein
MAVRLWLLPLTAALTSALMVAVAGAAQRSDGKNP